MTLVNYTSSWNTIGLEIGETNSSIFRNYIILNSTDDAVSVDNSYGNLYQNGYINEVRNAGAGWVAYISYHNIIDNLTIINTTWQGLAGQDFDNNTIQNVMIDRAGVAFDTADYVSEWEIVGPSCGISCVWIYR